MIHITFFGDFTLSENGKTLSCQGAGAYRLYRALAFLVKNRRRRIDREDFARFLHDNKPYRKGSDDSLVKVTLHRLRELLSELTEGETIIQKDGGIWLSPTLSFFADTDRFDALFEEYETAQTPSRRLSLVKELAALYRGRYLAPFFGEDFIMPEADRYHRRFIDLCEDAFARMLDLGAYREICEIAQKAAILDPYCEVFHYYRIYALILSGDKSLAASLHHSVSHLFLREFHITPSSRFRALSAHLPTTMSLEVKHCDEALSALQKTASETPDPYLFGDLREVFPTLEMLPSAELLFVKGEARSLLSHLKAVFPERTRVAKLSDRTLLVISTLDSAAFERGLSALRALLDRGVTVAVLEHKKYLHNN